MSASPRHAARHSAPRRARFRPGQLALSAAALLTLGTVGAGVAVAGPSTFVAAPAPSIQLEKAGASASTEASAAEVAGEAAVDTAALADRRKVKLSRSAGRRTAETMAEQTRWTTTELNLWARAGEDAKQIGEVPASSAVVLTGAKRADRVQVIANTETGRTGWVTAEYLSTTKPPPGISTAPCADSSIERGLKPQTVTLYRSVCHAFPEVSEYAGMAGRVEHNTGNAIDVMVYGDKELGDRIAAWALQHASALDLYDILWYQRIWTPVRSSEGWRKFADRGGATANHMDHVHLGTN